VSEIVLITGGCRSGKSMYGQRYCERIEGRHAYIATSPIYDEEMKQRIAVHQSARDPKKWKTFEEQLALYNAIEACSSHRVILIDCISLWISNVMYQCHKESKKVTESDIADLCDQVICACRKHGGLIVFISLEVGMGIVPSDSVSRLYRDLLGIANQVLAQKADKVSFMVSGLPLALKESV